MTPNLIQLWSPRAMVVLDAIGFISDNTSGEIVELNISELARDLDEDFTYVAAVVGTVQKILALWALEKEQEK